MRDVSMSSTAGAAITGDDPGLTRAARRRLLAAIVTVLALLFGPGLGSSAQAAATTLVGAISPKTGPLTGGTLVTVTGTGFLGVSKVLFGATAGTTLKVMSSTKLTVIAPRHAAGTVDVRVVARAGTSRVVAADKFGYTVPPNISGILPSTGPATGGTVVTITGSRLTGASLVLFGSKPGTKLTVLSATQVRVTTPASTVSGPLPVRVVTPSGSSPVADGKVFTYGALDVPLITTLTPSTGPTEGGIPLTVTGLRLGDATGVSFGAVPGTDVTVMSDTSLTVTTPPSSVVGAVPLTVTTLRGTSLSTPYTYVPPATAPDITGLMPPSGATSWGTVLTITGVNLGGATEVRIGKTLATSIVPVSDTEVIAVVPAGAVGAVPVTVTTPLGTTMVGPASTYTYVGVCAPNRQSAAITAASTATGGPAGTAAATIAGTPAGTPAAQAIGSSVAPVAAAEGDPVVKGPLRGTVSRANLALDLGGTRTEEVTGFALDVDWCDLEPEQNVFNFEGVAQALDWAAANGKQVRLRVRPGVAAPMWAKQLGGQPLIPFRDHDRRVDTTLGHYWEPAYVSAWRDLMTALAARFDSHPALAEVNISGTGLISAELMLLVPNDKTASGITNGQHLRNAGLTEPLRRAALIEEIAFMQATWLSTGTTLWGHTYQSVDGSASLATTYEIADAAIAASPNTQVGHTGADQAIVEGKQAMTGLYNRYAATGRLTLQTRALVGGGSGLPLGDLSKVLDWSAANGVLAVELPTGWQDVVTTEVLARTNAAMVATTG